MDVSVKSHHPDDKLVDVVWVTQLVDQGKQHTTRQHLLKTQHPGTLVRNYNTNTQLHGQTCWDNNSHGWWVTRLAAFV